MTAAACPAREDLSDYVLGKLPDDRCDTIAAHLETCLACQETLRVCDGATDPLIAGLRVPPVEDPYMQESGCREAIALVEAIGREPSMSVRRDEAGEAALPPGLGDIGQYRLLAKLGEGGMGTVYKALHMRLDKVVALKVLPRDRTQDPRAVARFSREMKAVGRLEHPHIVRAMDANEHDGTHYLVMEYVEGCDLGHLVQRCGPLSIADACELIRQAALGLQYAHENGLVHRDIKPSNLMLTTIESSRHTPCAVASAADGTRSVPATEGLVKILDLGLALLRADAPVGREMTGEGQMMGTADYIAPEQAADAHGVDIRADIYSLGCTLYKLLTGRAPFSDGTRKTPMAVVLAHMQEPAPSVRDLRPETPEALAAILARMMAKRPGQRFATPGEVAAALEPFTAGCDLVGLAAEATRPGADAPSADPTPCATEAPCSSALTGTTPSQSLPETRTAAPLAAPAGGSGRPRRWIALATAAAAAIPLLLGIWVIIRDKGGNQVAKLQVPEGGAATVVDDQGRPLNDGAASARREAEPKAQPSGTASARKRVEPVSINLTPEPLELPKGAPVSKMALVAQPAPIPGVRSWTIETIGHRGGVPVVAYSPDGRWLATASEDGTVRLWNAENEEFVRAIVAHDREIRALCWSPDSKWLATASRDRTVHVWDAETGRRWLTLPTRDGLASLAWSRDGQTLAAGSAEKGTIYLWRFLAKGPASGSRRQRPEGWTPMKPGIARKVIEHVHHESQLGVIFLCWSPDSKELAFGRCANPMHMYSLNIMSDEIGLVRGAPDYWSNSIDWSPDGTMFVLAGGTGGVFTADTGKRREMFRPNSLYDCAIWLSDGKHLVIGNRYVDGDLACVWNIVENRVVAKFPKPFAASGVCSLTGRHDGKRVTIGRDLTKVPVYDIESGRLVQELPGHAGSVLQVHWLADGRTVARVGDQWCAVDALSGFPTSPDSFEQLAVHHSAIAPDGRTLALGMYTHVLLWDMTTRRMLRRFAPGDYSVSNIRWAPDGQTIAVGAEGRPVELWDAEKAALLRKLPQKGSALAFSPDGERLAVGSDGQVIVCDAQTGEAQPALAIAAATIAALAWSPDGKLLAAGAEDKKVYLWDLQARRSVAVGERHEATPTLLAWLDGGRRLLSGSENQVCVWDAATGKLDRTFAADATSVSPDGQRVATRGKSAVRMHRLADGALERTLLALRDKQYAAISLDGHFSGSPEVEHEFVYVVQTDAGQETLTPAQFASRYGWKNDPAKVNLTGQPRPTQPAGSGAATRPKPAAIELAPVPDPIELARW